MKFTRPGFEAAETAPVRRSTVMIVIATVLAVLFAIIGSVYFALRPVNLRIAVGPPGSEDTRLIQGFAQALGRDRGNIRLRTSITEGALASATALDNETVDLAVVRGDVAMPKNAQAVAVMRKNVVVIWAPAPAKGKTRAARVKKIEDLAGHRVGVIGRTQANVNVLRLILTQYGIAHDKVQIVQFGTNEVAEAVRVEKVDAFFAVGPMNSQITADAIAASSRYGSPVFLSIDSNEAIAQHFPAYEATEITAGAFGSAPAKPDDAVKTIGVSHYLVARKGLSEAVVTNLTRALFTVRQSIANELPQAAKIETPDTDKDAVVPVHPGAAAYVDGEEKSFFDRYSDLLYIALIALSGLGSAIAWFASYLKKDERTNHAGLRERLLDMLARARATDSDADLDALQAEADDILRHTLHGYEAGVVDESALMAFNIVLQQTHLAIADRRALLVNEPPRPARTNIAVLPPPAPESGVA